MSRPRRVYAPPCPRTGLVAMVRLRRRPTVGVMQRVVLAGFLILHLTVALAYEAPITLLSTSAVGATNVRIPGSAIFPLSGGGPEHHTALGYYIRMPFDADSRWQAHRVPAA